MGASADNGMRRALARARDGKTLDAGEAEVLLGARGEDLDRLLESAGRVRDSGLAAAGRAGLVTYSRKVFIPLTRLCRDRCHYCTFATTPGRLRADGEGLFLTPDEVVDLARQGAALGCKEALFTLGDRPEDRWPEAQEWLEAHGYDSTLGYLRAMAVRVLEETGLLPHLNPGVLTWSELQRLKPVAPSMGMMLETMSERLWAEPGQPHFGSPDKEPAVRLRVLEDAGRSSIPFTTGILVGHRRDAGRAGRGPARHPRLRPAARARARGHRPELPGQGAHPDARESPTSASRTTSPPSRSPGCCSVRGCASRCRRTSPTRPSSGLLLRAGVDDWGGVSPLTPDHVNPERPWPHLDDLTRLTAEAGFTLVERLTAHPEYVLAPEPWLDPRVRPHVAALADPATGLGVEGRCPTGLPWQEPDPDWGSVAAGRVDLHVEVDTVGRTDDRRSDFDAVYGDWAAVGEQVHDEAKRQPVRLAVGDPAVRAALRRAHDDPAGLTDDEYLALMTATGVDLDAVCRLADDVRRAVVGDDVTYVVNRNINFTNVCYTGCRFCAFAQRRTDADAYTLSLEQVADRAQEAWNLGATEVCMQGGIHPDLPGTAYFELARAVKARVPEMHVHAFSPMEVVNGASRTGMSYRDFLLEAKAAGLDSVPGTAAEILDDDVRWVLTKGKLPAASLGRDHQDRPRGGSAEQRDDDVRPRRRPAPLGGAPARPGPAAGRDGRLHRVRARCRSCTRAPRSTSPGSPAPDPRSRRTGPSTRSRGCCCTGASTTCRRRG